MGGRRQTDRAAAGSWALGSRFGEGVDPLGHTGTGHCRTQQPWNPEGLKRPAEEFGKGGCCLTSDGKCWVLQSSGERGGRCRAWEAGDPWERAAAVG